MKNTTTTYTILPTPTGRRCTNRKVSLLLKALQPGEYFYAKCSEQTDVNSLKRSLTKTFTTKKQPNGLLKVTCTFIY